MKDKKYFKNSRLLTYREHKQVFDNTCKKVLSKYFVVLSKNNEIEICRLGIVAAKKHFKLAVDRNRLKRLIRESFRHNQNELPPRDFVVIARSGVLLETNKTLRIDLDKLWLKLGK